MNIIMHLYMLGTQPHSIVNIDSDRRPHMYSSQTFKMHQSLILS